jgi:hypothetical protein
MNRSKDSDLHTNSLIYSHLHLTDCSQFTNSAQITMRYHHKHRLLSRIACLAGLLLTTITVMTTANSAEAVERYEVELIIFRHVDQSRSTPEIPAASSIFRPSPLNLTIADIPAPFPDNPAEPVGMPGNTPGKQRHQPPITFYLLELDPTYPDFVPMRDEMRTLSQIYARLDTIDAYQPISHVGWIQPARDTDNAKPYRFTLPAAEPSTGATMSETGVTGTITLYKGRFLHLEVDLTLEVDKPADQTWSFLGAGTKDSPDMYKLTESRRIQGTATHYFDHPQFGVIARIQQVKTKVAAGEENG